MNKILNWFRVLLFFTLLSITSKAQVFHGEKAINQFGPQIAEVAKQNGTDVQTLIKTLRQDKSLGIDKKGQLLYVCDGVQVNTPQSIQTIITTADAFNLNSLPGATRVIYLDFDGHTTAGTSWNGSYNAGNPIVSEPFDLDGDPLTFNDAERTLIIDVWKRVAEDYAPFNVNVTTVDPGVENLKKSSSSDVNYGVRVVISPTNWYKTSAGGVAYIGSFSWDTDTPCFAFTQQLANHEKYIGEAVAHEAGHTVGLYHDGTSTTAYFEGHGDWAPIMGVGYYRSTVQFSKGEYYDANNTQDDLAVIAGHIPVVSDDHSNTLSNATVLVGPDVSDGGTLERRTDVDIFRLDLADGPLSLNVSSPSNSPDATLKVELLNSAGAVLLEGNAINVTLTAGTYYLRIDGIGVGDPLTDGYSDYGSLGNYVIVGTIVPSSNPPPPPPPPPPPAELIPVDVYALSLTQTRSKAGTTVFAVIQMKDANGVGIPNVSVTVQWSGLVSAGKSGVTDNNGQVTISSPKTKKYGTVNATISNVVAPVGYVYDSVIYTEPTTESITLTR